MPGGTELLDAEVFTLLGVRLDGFASVVDLVADGLATARQRAEALLAEHASCVSVELWRDGGLVEKVLRA